MKTRELQMEIGSSFRFNFKKHFFIFDNRIFYKEKNRILSWDIETKIRTIIHFDDRLIEENTFTPAQYPEEPNTVLYYKDGFLVHACENPELMIQNTEDVSTILQIFYLPTKKKIFEMVVHKRVQEVVFELALYGSFNAEARRRNDAEKKVRKT